MLVHFVVAVSDEGKKRIAKGAQGFYAFNEIKVLDAQAVIVFASKIDLDDEFLNHIIEKEDKDGRFPKEEFKQQNHGARSYFAYMHKYDLKDFQHWAEKQVYLNIGCFMAGVATMGLDCIAMEGFDFKVIDDEFGLREKGFISGVVISVGYHKEGDFNKDLPKSRLLKSEIITKI